MIVSVWELYRFVAPRTIRKARAGSTQYAVLVGRFQSGAGYAAEVERLANKYERYRYQVRPWAPAVEYYKWLAGCMELPWCEICRKRLTPEEVSGCVAAGMASSLCRECVNRKLNAEGHQEQPLAHSNKPL